MSKGWSSAGLKTVGDDDRYWTVAEASALLGIRQESVRSLILAAHLEPIGKRRTTRYGQSGRYARVYEADDILSAREALSRRSTRQPADPDTGREAAADTGQRAT